MVVHVHELVAEDAANLALVEYVEDALRAAYGCMALVAARCERVGAHGRGDVDARHRLAGLGAEFAHDAVQCGSFLLGDRVGAHRGDGEFVGEPVRAERGDQTDDDIYAQRAAVTAGSPPDQHDDGPHQRKEQRRFQAVEVAAHMQFTVHSPHTKFTV